MRRLGSVFGFPIYAQPTFLFLIALWVLPNARDLSSLQSGLIAGAVLTISIIVHELGHAFAFRTFGEPHATIVLWGLGGLTYGRKPGRAWKDIVISLAGPFFGFVLGMASLIVTIVLGEGIHPRLGEVLHLLILLNLFWTFFNLLPLHPMDGGQALRSLLVAWKGQRGLKASLVLSILTAALVGFVSWRVGQTFLIILAALMLLRNAGELRGQDAGLPTAPGQ